MHSASGQKIWESEKTTPDTENGKSIRTNCEFFTPSGRRKTKGEQEQRQQIPEIVADQSDPKDSVNLTQNDLDNAPRDGISLTSSRNRIDWSTSELDLPRNTFERPEKVRKGKGIPFWKWSIGERVVVYLAICDFGFSAIDISNHAYLYFMVRHPPDAICTAIGFLIHEFIISQAVVVLFMAMSACVQVVFGRRIKLGRWDYRLIALAFGVPFVIGAVLCRVWPSRAIWGMVSEFLVLK